MPRARVERVDVVDALAASRPPRAGSRRRTAPPAPCAARRAARCSGALGRRPNQRGATASVRAIYSSAMRTSSAGSVAWFAGSLSSARAEVADAGMAELARELPARRFDAVEAREAVVVDAARVLVERRVGRGRGSDRAPPRRGDGTRRSTVAGVRLVRARAARATQPRPVGRSVSRSRDDRVALAPAQLRMGDEESATARPGSRRPRRVWVMQRWTTGRAAVRPARSAVLQCSRCAPRSGREGREARAQAVDPLLAVDALEPGELPVRPCGPPHWSTPVDLPERALVGAPEAADRRRR